MSPYVVYSSRRTDLDNIYFQDFIGSLNRLRRQKEINNRQK